MSISPDTIALTRTGSGPPMVMVHGLPGTHSVWSPLQETLGRCRTLVAIDLPGFGGSPAPDDPHDLSLQGLADAVLDLARAQGFERFDLAGHSFGAAVAATAALRAPERVRTLALVAPMGVDVPPLARLGRARSTVAAIGLLWRIAPRALRRRAVEIGVKLNYGKAYLRHRAEQIARELDRDDAVSQIFRTIAAVDFDEYRTIVEKLQSRSTIPVLVFGGGSDRIIPARQHQRYAELLRRAEKWYDPKGVHVLMWQSPEAIASMIREFIERDDESG